jgi:hypothetical protein
MTEDCKTPAEEGVAMEADVQAHVAVTLRENEARWGKLYSEWLRQRATYAEGLVEDEESDRIAARENEIVHEMISTPAPTSHAILDKIDILQNYMEMGSNWTDKRDFLLLASIRADVRGME